MFWKFQPFQGRQQFKRPLKLTSYAQKAVSLPTILEGLLAMQTNQKIRRQPFDRERYMRHHHVQTMRLERAREGSYKLLLKCPSNAPRRCAMHEEVPSQIDLASFPQIPRTNHKPFECWGCAQGLLATLMSA